MTNANRKRNLALLLALVVIAVAVYGFLADTPPPEPAEAQRHMPTGKPLREPDRPDLIGDPGIADEDNEQGEIPDD